MRRTDWVAWHRHYDDPDSRFSVRLRLVQTHVRLVLDRQDPGPIRVLVPCAGQGRDLLGVVADHPRRTDVVATLIELDPQNVEIARSTARQLNLAAVTVVQGDAGKTDAYVGVVPASLIILVGLFAHLNRRDLERLIRSLPQLCARDTIVVWAHGWTAQRHSVASIRERFRAANFSQVPSGVEPSTEMYVAIERFDGEPQPLRPGVRLFTFDRVTDRPVATLRRQRAAVASRVRHLARTFRIRSR